MNTANLGRLVRSYLSLKDEAREIQDKISDKREVLLEVARAGTVETDSWKVALNNREARSLDEDALRAEFGDDVIDRFVKVSNVEVLQVVSK